MPDYSMPAAATWRTSLPPVRWWSGPPAWPRSCWKTPSTPGASAIAVEIQHGGLTYHPHHRQRLRHRRRTAAHGLSAPCHQQAARRRRIWPPSVRWASGARRWPPSPPCHGWISSPGARGAQTGGRPCIWRGASPAGGAEAGCPEGTTICVRDLFYNTPARMKFMKKDCCRGRPPSAGIVQHLALSHPGDLLQAHPGRAGAAAHPR